MCQYAKLHQYTNLCKYAKLHRCAKLCQYSKKGPMTTDLYKMILIFFHKIELEKHVSIRQWRSGQLPGFRPRPNFRSFRFLTFLFRILVRPGCVRHRSVVSILWNLCLNNFSTGQWRRRVCPIEITLECRWLQKCFLIWNYYVGCLWAPLLVLTQSKETVFDQMWCFFYNKSKILTVLFIVKYEKITL